MSRHLRFIITLEPRGSSSITFFCAYHWTQINVSSFQAFISGKVKYLVLEQVGETTKPPSEARKTQPRDAHHEPRCGKATGTILSPSIFYVKHLLDVHGTVAYMLYVNVRKSFSAVSHISP